MAFAPEIMEHFMRALNQTDGDIRAARHYATLGYGGYSAANHSEEWHEALDIHRHGHELKYVTE